MDDTLLFTYRDDELYFHHTVTPDPKPEHFPFRLHSHSMHELFYFVSGNAEYTVEGTSYELEKGTLILSAGGQMHHIRFHPAAEPYERIVLMFSLKLLYPVMEELIRAAEGGNHVFRLSEREQVWFEENCLSVENNALSDKEKHDTLNAFLTLTLSRLSSFTAISTACTEQKNDLVQQIIRFIHRNLTSELSLDILEHALFRDKAYLNRIFRSAMGCSIWEYVIQKRIFNARQQLFVTGNIAQAYASSGFHDYSVFYRNYMRWVGVSPSVDLKMLRP